MTTDENELPDEALDEEDLPGYFTERLPVPLSAELFDQTVVALTTTLRARGTTKDAASAAAKALSGMEAGVCAIAIACGKYAALLAIPSFRVG